MEHSTQACDLLYKECEKIHQHKIDAAMPIQSKIDAFCHPILQTLNEKHNTLADKENKPPAKRRRIVIHDSDSEGVNVADGSVDEQLRHANDTISTINHHTASTIAASNHVADITSKQQHGDGDQVLPVRVPRTIHTETVTAV